MVRRISFNVVDIFPSVIVLLFHLISIFCLALLEKYMVWSLLPWYGLGYPRQPSNLRQIYRAFISGNVIPCRPSPSWLCMWIIPNLKRFCETDLNVKLVFTSFKIKNMFSFKDRTPDALKSMVVYQFTCAGCNFCYR